MVKSQIPENCQDLIAGYILGNLSEEEAAILENLLSEHPELLPEVESFDNAFNVFAEVVPIEPPDRLKASILAAANAVEPRPQETPTIPQPFRAKRFKLVLGLGSAIAASLIAALGLRTYFLSAELQQANAKIQTLERNLTQAIAQADNVRPVLSTLQQPGTLLYTLEGSANAYSASGSLVMSPKKKQVILLVHNLPQLPEGRIYRLWAKIPTHTSVTYCGQFNSNTQGFIQLTPSSDTCGANPKQMLITLDAVTDPTTQGGPVIMQSRI